MITPKNSITERAQRCANTLVDCEDIAADGMAVIIEAYKKDLQDILRNEPVIDNVMVQSTQNYFMDIGSNLDNKITTNQIIITALENIRVAFREATKTHNINQKNTHHEVIQMKIEFPETIKQEVEINAAHAPLIQKKKEIRKKKEFLPTPPPTPTEKSIPKPKPPAFELPESYRKNSIFGSKKRTTKPTEKSVEEKQFDFLMRTKSPTQGKPILQEQAPSESTTIHFTNEELDHIKEIWQAIDHTEYTFSQQTIMHYKEIISIMSNQNQTPKTGKQKSIINLCIDILEKKTFSAESGAQLKRLMERLVAFK